MFRTLICPSSGACDYIDGLPQFIPEQSPGEANPLFQMAISTQPPHTTQTEQ